MHESRGIVQVPNWPSLGEVHQQYSRFISRSARALQPVRHLTISVGIAHCVRHPQPLHPFPSQPRSACDTKAAHSPASGARQAAGRLLAAMAAQACSPLTGQQRIKAARQPRRAAVQVSCSLRRSHKQAFVARWAEGLPICRGTWACSAPSAAAAAAAATSTVSAGVRGRLCGETSSQLQCLHVSA